MPSKIDISGNKITIPIGDIIEMTNTAIFGLTNRLRSSIDDITSEGMKSPRFRDTGKLQRAAHNVENIAPSLAKATKLLHALEHAVIHGDGNDRDELEIDRFLPV